MAYPTVASVMTTEVVTVTINTPYRELVRLLAEHRISAVPVVDADQRPVGVVSELDLLRKEEFRRDKPAWSLWDWVRRPERTRASAHTAGGLMSRPVQTIPAATELDSAAHQLAVSGVRRLFVVDDAGRLAGVLARRDVLRPFLRPAPELSRAITEDVLRRVLWALPGQVEVRVEHGVVTLSGHLELASDIDLALTLSRAVPGVVDVVDELECSGERTR
ncbi:CBS-domain-containing membrane protein [Crossiella equi]|uniref:CBS-domain-containing membrane protein n=1 Tax=Crossiella equi TaxID=130796 RepID=A0ABS5A5H5_9PSEU|nr:CBS domain-containing protein [Crossiella equi]MBP2471847.1 CBS-domain-containing membrane protein [Crossiella equi]